MCDHLLLFSMCDPCRYLIEMKQPDLFCTIKTYFYIVCRHAEKKGKAERLRLNMNTY